MIRIAVVRIAVKKISLRVMVIDSKCNKINVIIKIRAPIPLQKYEIHAWCF